MTTPYAVAAFVVAYGILWACLLWQEFQREKEHEEFLRTCERINSQFRHALELIRQIEDERNQWKSCVPSHCPITGLPHHGNFKMHETGEYKAFYGGPIISYGLPYKDSDNYLSRERLDEDDMSSEDETMCLLIMEEEELGAMQERIARLEAVRVAAEGMFAPDAWSHSWSPLDVLREALQAASSDEPATSYGVAVNETGFDEQQAVGEESGHDPR